MELEKNLDGMLVVARSYNPYKMRAMGHCNKILENYFIRYMEKKSPMTMQEFLYGCPPDTLSDSNLAGWVTPSKNILKAMHTLALPNPPMGNQKDEMMMMMMMIMMMMMLIIQQRMV